MKAMLAGFGIGAAAAILLAPRSGKETRSDLAKRVTELVKGVRPEGSESTKNSQATKPSLKLNLGAESKAIAAVLNSADRHELMSVNGIGKTTATRILKHRPFDSAEEVLQEGVLPEETLEHVKDELLHKNRDIA